MNLQENKRSFIKIFREWIIPFGFVIILSLLIRNYAFAQVIVEQHSMENTILDGQRVIENKIQYVYSKPKRGEVVIMDQRVRNGLLKE